MTRFTPEFLEDRKESNGIQLAIIHAIPEGSHYSAIIVALTELLQDTVTQWVTECCEDRWYGGTDGKEKKR